MPDDLSNAASPGPPPPAPLGGGTPPAGPGQTPAALDTAPPVLGTLPPPPGAATPARTVSRLRALLLSLVVLAVGAGLGAAGFVYEQSHVTWKPQTEKTGDGWRISTSHGLRLGDAALGKGHIVWNAGPFTVLTGLTDGESKLLGARAFAGKITAPAISARYVTWMDVHYQGDNVVWVYDIERRRRTQLEGLAGITRSPVLAGSIAVWAAGLGQGRGFQVRSVDLVTGRQTTIADTPVADDLIAGGDLCAWISRAASAEPPVITVADVRTGTRRQIAPYARSGGRMVGFAVAGRFLVWARDTGPGTAAEVLSYDVGTGVTKVVASAGSIEAVAAGGDLIAWSERASGGDTRIVGVHPAGGTPFVIALLSGPAPSDVYANGKLAAWRVSPMLLFESYLQTATIAAGPTASRGDTGTAPAGLTGPATVTRTGPATVLLAGPAAAALMSPLTKAD